MKAMLLAAGRGTRMAPLTPQFSKPTLPVLGDSLIALLVRDLARQGVSQVVINAHQNESQLRASLRDSPIPIEFSLEEELRGSGGGIAHARRFLDAGSPFLVLNADMCIQIDVQSLVHTHQRSGAVATLALRDDPRKTEFGTIGYAEQRDVCRITEISGPGSEIGCGLFTGVHVLEPSIFEQMPNQPAFGIVRDVYIPWLQSGQRIASWLQPAAQTWWPVGSPDELLDANLRALEQVTQDVAQNAVIEGTLHPPVWIGPAAEIPRGAQVGPRTVVGAGARVPAESHWQESVLLPQSRPEQTGPVRGAIAFGTGVWSRG